jgi:hypothetical protein
MAALLLNRTPSSIPSAQFFVAAPRRRNFHVSTLSSPFCGRAISLEAAGPVLARHDVSDAAVEAIVVESADGKHKH